MGLSSPSVTHRVSIPEPKTHLVHVETTVRATGPLPESIVLFMAVWTPGSYLVREYARHVESLVADEPSRATKIRKNAWRVDVHGAASVVVRYRVYAGDLTVRTSHVDETHAFLVGAALFLGLEGGEDLGAHVEISGPSDWRSSTSLRTATNGPDVGVHRFDAPTFDALVDSPIELGTHQEERFEALGKPHRFSIWPANSIADASVRRLVDDTKTIVETEAALFGGALPYDAYELLLHFSLRGRGGLEHRSSAALIASPGAFAARDSYLDMLSLVAHEVFHAWNVKRIRPAGLTPYRYGEECYTRLLWWFEGATSYYDWRVLRLARLCTVDEYLDHLGGEIAYLDQTPGRLVHALEEASFDAWIKLYRPDEHSANSSVSYYRKGEVVCALLDIELRMRTRGRASLDTILAHLWETYGIEERPVPEDAMQRIFERVAGLPLGELFDAWIRSATEIDYARSLAHVGLTIERSARSDGPASSLGVRIRPDGGRALVASVSREGAAWRAGIDPGDEVIAIGGTRIEGTTLDSALRGRTPGDEVDVTIARDGRVVTKRAKLDGPKRDRVKVVVERDAAPSARQAFADWLGEPHPAWGGERAPT
ncbi:MAG: M61 family metallopeptidase [Polyangiaceae bacterium]